MTLVSPGTQVSVSNESFYIPVSATTVPLIFLATRANKYQPDGKSIADGSNEHGVVRTITSIGQSAELYGVPYFWKDNSGSGQPAQHYGDARNETGLFALNQFLGIGNLAYVVRANVDLTDEPTTFYSAGIPQYDANSLVQIGVGNGTISSISVPSQLKEPEAFSIVAIGIQALDIIEAAANGTEAPMSFTVTGSKSGLIGVAKAGTPFVHSAIHFTITERTAPFGDDGHGHPIQPVAFAAGDYFEFSTVYTAAYTGTGNGTLVGLASTVYTVAEDITITFTSATEYKVIGTEITAGAQDLHGTGVVGSPFNASSGINKFEFTINAGTVPFVVGDEFTFSLTAIHIYNTLGNDDAQKRATILTALQGEINSNQDVRSEAYEYNLILCPGFPEVVDELLGLSDYLGNEAFVIADTYINKNPDQTANWAASNASDHRIHTDVAYYYPWGLASNLDGYNVAVAPSGIALRTFAYSDNQSELWRAPAGLRRGLISGVDQVGYVTGTLGLATTFVQANVNQGQRDNLYNFPKNINPLLNLPGYGLVVWGQKTSVGNSASARDRINVERLLCYIRRQLRKSSYTFLFEPNDQQTRDQFKAMVDGFLSDIMVRRGLYDFVTLCDSSNNTPVRIDRNEMWCDIGLKPVKAIEFIYIPIRVLATGAKMGTA